MNGIFEVVVHFSKFKNIDLFRQGLYCIRATLHSFKPEDEKSLPAGEGMPYYLIGEKKLHERVSQNKKIVYASKINDSLRAFYSKTFRVQYVDQEVDLEDACLFRFERKRGSGDSCYLALELLFAEYNSTDYAMRREYPPQTDFEMVSLRWFTINKFKSGHGSGFYPSTFDDSHFCLLDTMVHFMLIDYQFRQTTLQWKPPAGSTKKQPYNLTCKTFEQWLFPKNLLKVTGNAYNEREVRSIADKNHLNFVTRLISAFNSLARTADPLPGEEIDELSLPHHMLRDRPPPSPNSPAPIVPKFNNLVVDEAVAAANASVDMISSKGEKVEGGDGATTKTKTETNMGASDRKTSRRRGISIPTHPSGLQIYLQKENRKRFVFPPLARFSKRIEWTPACTKDTKICGDVALLLTKDIKSVAEQNFQLWNKFIRLIPKYTKEMREVLHREYLELLHERITCFIFRERFAHKDRWRCAPKDLFAQHTMQANKVRKGWGQATMAKLVLEDPELFPDPNDHVVVFEESFDSSNPSNEYKGRMSSLNITNNHFSTAESHKNPINASSSNASTVTQSLAKGGSSISDSTTAGSNPQTVGRSLGPSVGLVPAKSGADTDIDRAETDPMMAWGTMDSDRKEVRTSRATTGASTALPIPSAVHAELPTLTTALGTKNMRSQTSNSDYIDTKSSDSHNNTKRGGGEKETIDDESEENKHVVVFVHGYQGNSWDMRLFKNHLALLFPNHLFMLSSSNEGHTEGDIGEMGARLATEIVDFVVENCPLGFKKLSIVAHSLGGLISRAAIARKELAPYQSKMHTFISLASPHCGYMYSKNTVLDTGIWVLKKWSKSLCLTQLSMTDHQNHEECFVYKLSKKKGLEYFKNCLLLASHQDYYSPFHSSRIELHHDALRSQKHGKIFTSMVQNILKPLKRPIKRYNISFVHKKTNLDSIIGRTAHILFLDNHLYMIMMCHIYKDLFE
mmetsp:Transcript_33699/g.81606  ORF Transcript_33699/g.81606 Transcript_33699/m.81606 type:complete len:966 (+) Transcript_33699:70-2967(+)|eukprot:CAMPEP_0114516344 /NCGR_PEP_ID=MMETSP0109-20121206/17274_1 /TAXON_ID=29199 /ORGANISM="Chlorarachnion reptans, Strain CCCM449" /LENGTH=965 /DNA_ID=CAMNT_0001696719 /DNA_START=59 /DNA_END=2956 /DNA_ORIENTATION=-